MLLIFISTLGILMAGAQRCFVPNFLDVDVRTLCHLNFILCFFTELALFILLGFCLLFHCRSYLHLPVSRQSVWLSWDLCVCQRRLDAWHLLFLLSSTSPSLQTISTNSLTDELSAFAFLATIRGACS